MSEALIAQHAFSMTAIGASGYDDCCLRRRRQTIQKPMRILTLIVLAMLPVGASLLWLQSFRVHDRYVWADGASSWGIVNCNGRLQIRVIRAPLPTGLQRLGGYWSGDIRGIWENDGTVLRSAGPAALAWQHGGIPFQGSWYGPTPSPAFVFTYSYFTVAHWLIVLISLLPAALLFRRLRRNTVDERPAGFPALQR